MKPRSLGLVLGASLAAMLPASAGLAQMPDGSIVLPPNVSIHDIGWSQLRNLGELREFVQAVVETLILITAFAFHPRANALRRDAGASTVQTSLFLFGLIGMLVGFLVVHHGFLIGFVVFGLGGLFRFRMESSSLIDSALLVLVTLVGLTVGLNLPVMGLVATAAGWITLWFAAARTSTTVELKFEDDAALKGALEHLHKAFGQQGFQVTAARKTNFKPVVELVLMHKDPGAENAIPAILEELGDLGYRVKDWHVA